jgi:hypothetical protein
MATMSHHDLMTRVIAGMLPGSKRRTAHVGVDDDGRPSGGHGRDVSSMLGALNRA